MTVVLLTLWGLVFIFVGNATYGLAQNKGRNPWGWVVLVFLTGPVALALLATWPRLKPTEEDLYFEVWRMGVQQAERAIIDHFAAANGAEHPTNEPLQRIVIAATKSGGVSPLSVLERRARMVGAFEPERISRRTVSVLAEALALDPDDAIHRATARLLDPRRVFYE